MARAKPKGGEGKGAAAAVNGPVAEVLTLAEAAAYLRVGEADVLRWVEEQGLPGRQSGKEWRFSKAAIQQWLSAGGPTLQSRKEAQLALAGKYKDDPDLLRICEEAYRQRGRPMTEGEARTPSGQVCPTTEAQLPAGIT